MNKTVKAAIIFLLRNIKINNINIAKIIINIKNTNVIIV